jgi:hypothetical protein
MPCFMCLKYRRECMCERARVCVCMYVCVYASLLKLEEPISHRYNENRTLGRHPSTRTHIRVCYDIHPKNRSKGRSYMLMV